ncbi:MAG: hypothetical protein AABX13_04220 [Nanoarchaeota archaeon]
MEALLIVHLERDHLSPKLVGKERAEKNGILFQGIAELVPQHLDVQGNRAYYLAESAESATSTRIYGPLKDYFSRAIHPPVQFIPHGNSFEEQSILVKEKLIEDEADSENDRVYIVGVSYEAQLRPLQRFLAGDVARLHRSEFRGAWEFLERSAEKFDRLYRRHLNVEVKEELTDK